MRKIDLKGIIDSRGLDAKEIAKQLFPKNKYPDLALNRVLKGINVLDADQISKLALISGLKISELFSGENWKSGKQKGDILTLSNGEYMVELNIQSWVAKVYHNETMFHEEVLSQKTIPMNDFLAQIDMIINNFKVKENENSED